MGYSTVDDRLKYRRTYTYDRRKNNKRQKKLNKFLFKIILILILIFLFDVKDIKTTTTDYVKNSVELILTKHPEIVSILHKANNETNLFMKRHNLDVNVIYKQLVDKIGITKNKDKKQQMDIVSCSMIDGGRKTDNYNYCDSGEGSIDYSYLKQESKSNKLIERNNIKVTPRFIYPINGIIKSGFGERQHPIKNGIKFHYGIDIASSKGSEIKASMNGRVVVATTDSTYGKYIRIDNNNYTTLYAHCSEILTKKGSYVKQGDVIAKVGDTGASVGPHLHFEIWEDNLPKDPLNLLTGDSE